MTKKEIKLLERQLAKCRNYLEYGAGGSTKLAAKTRTIESIVSVESDPIFVKDEVLTSVSVKHAIDNSRLRFLTVDIGPTVEWGYPLNSNKSYLWPNYALSPFMHGSEVPDLILIDGRFRVACAITAALEAPNATILIHDYSIREKYHFVEKFFEIKESADSLFKFKRLHNFDEHIAKKYLKHYLYSPNDDSQTLYARSRRDLGSLKKKIFQLS